MRRLLGIALLVLVVLIAFVAARGDRRTPGEPAPATPDAQLAGGARRLDLRFPCGDSVCAGWLYLPAGAEKPPVVVMGHGFAGTRDVGVPVVAERLVREGVAAFAFDYRSFGASGGSPRQIVDPWHQLDDWRAALAFVRNLAEVDAERLGIWGSSLGAGHALIIAAEDERLGAVVLQTPLIDTSLEGEATFYGAGWAARLVLTGWWDLLCSAFGCEPVTMPAIARRGEFGMIIDDAAHAAVDRVAPPGSTYRNAVAARSIFMFDDYNPAARAESVDAPVLLIASHTDRFAPFAAVQSFAERADNATVETFEGDHFDVYSPPAVTRAADLAAAFFAAKLRAVP
jgi:pimeloyl-ACP methyl ester carboxylesterase